MVTGIECEKPGDVNSMAAFLNAAVILIRNLWMSWDLWQSFAKRQSIICEAPVRDESLERPFCETEER